MSSSSYSEKLRDPRWQRKRLEILNRDKFTCIQCKCTDKTLHVHHCFYEWGRDPWDYPDTSLITLCETCHEDESALADMKKLVITELSARGALSWHYDSIACDIHDIFTTGMSVTEFTGVMRELVAQLIMRPTSDGTKGEEG